MAMRNGYRGSRGRSYPTTKIFVGQLPDTCHRDELKALFETFGKVVECDVVKDYGFVHFQSEGDAKAAVAALNDHEVKGSRIRVEISTSKVRQKAGMGGSTQCYRCGKGGHWSKTCPLGPSRPRDREDDGYGRGPRGPRGGAGRYPYPPPDEYFDYFRGRFPPPPPFRFSPYDRERFPFPPPPPGYFRDRYYDRQASPPPRDPYYDMYAAAYMRRYGGSMPHQSDN